MSPMITIVRDLDTLIKESGAEKIDLDHSTAEYDESFENIKFGLIANSMQEAKYNGCNFENCEFSGLDMRYSEFDDGEFINCDFGLAKLDFVNARRSHFYGDDVYFTGARLVQADFSGSIIDGAGFSGIDAYGAKFFCASLRKANFADADLSFANFKCADLRGANFAGANLKGADFTDAQLDGAQFDGAIMDGWTIIEGWNIMDGWTKLPAEYQD